MAKKHKFISNLYFVKHDKSNILKSVKILLNYGQAILAVSDSVYDLK